MSQTPENYPAPPPGGEYQGQPGQPGYAGGPPPGYGGPPPRVRPRNGLGIAALVLGILAIITVYGGIVLGVLAIIFGVIGRNRVKRGEATNGGVALAGIITGAIGLIIAIAVIVFVVLLASSPAAKNYQTCLKNAGQDQAARQSCAQQFGKQLTS